MMDIFRKAANYARNHEIFIEEVRKVNELMDLRGSGSIRGSPKLEHFVNTRSIYDHGRVTMHGEGDVLSIHVTPTTQPR
jgi:hypothetical protein